MRKNTSGFVGVSLHESGKWHACVGSGSGRLNLGLHATAEAAREARQKALSRQPPAPDLMQVRRLAVLETARSLYAAQGASGLKASALEANGLDFGKLRRVGFENHAALIQAIGATDAYAQWRASSRVQPKWTWERAVEVAKELVEKDGDLPTVEQCRLSGRSQLHNAVARSGHTWDELRAAAGAPQTVMRNGKPRYFNSRIGIRWRSRPEACLSNFLYARGIEHKRGERYPDGYAKQSGRAYGRYDLHFKSATGDWIDVEIWGDIPDAYSHGRYARTRAFKEAWHAGDPSFLGVQYQDCLFDARLTVLLERFVGVIAPFQFDKPQDREIETAHWSDADEFLETCREIAAQMPDGIFPGDEWLRKRGRYADRPGEPLNTISQRVNAWMGGTRRVRALLGQAEASTTKWTPESVIEAWQRFESTYNMTPSQCKGASAKLLADPSVLAEGARIYEVARRLGVVDQARGGRTARKARWTHERAITEWRRFEREYGLSPSQAMGPIQRARLPSEVGNDAARIYSAALRLGAIEAAKSADATE